MKNENQTNDGQDMRVVGAVVFRCNYSELQQIFDHINGKGEIIYRRFAPPNKKLFILSEEEQGVKV
jgi:hypothetical protein